MLRIVRKKPARPPGAIRMPQEFWDKAAQVAIGSIIENILTQRQADGTRIKANAPATRARKRKQGKRLLSLIDEQHRFVRTGRASWTLKRYLPQGAGIVIGPATEELRQLVWWVWQAGYRGYIGLSKKGRAAIRALIRKSIQDMINRRKAASQR